MPQDACWSDRILDYAEDGRHRGPLAGATHSGEAANPYCGDVVKAHVILAVGKLAKVSFEASGCTLVRAAAAILGEEADGMPRWYARLLTDSEMIELVGIEESSPKRMCAILPLIALRKAMRDDGDDDRARERGRAA